MRSQEQTHCYKVVGDCEIKADVHTGRDGGVGRVVVWVHGGALILGGRDWLPAWQRDAYLAAGYQVVAVDYRLAPESKLPAIVEDLVDACRWVRERGPELFGADPERVAVVGHSAGGYLALMAGVRVMPPPRAVVSFYGYGDIVGPWYSEPDLFYCQQPLVREEEARASVGEAVISETKEHERRGQFYLYCRQQGRWPKEVAGHDARAEEGWFRDYCPVHKVRSDYPPTLLVHGDRDTDVPYEQSVMMARALGEAGVEHRLITIANGEHGFDGEANEAAMGAVQSVVEFLGAHV